MKLSIYLRRKKLSQRDFCKIIGVSHATINNYMRGVREPRKEIVKKIKRAMKAKIVEFK